jgi:glucose-6-phosphate-specific signal transduction histidine kinase
VPERALSGDHETALYCIVREALTNAIKHAQASSVSIVVAASGSVVRTVIEDDGVGFAVDKIREGALGLVGMRERVTLLGGRFEIDSAPNTARRCSSSSQADMKQPSTRFCPASTRIPSGEKLHPEPSKRGQRRST